jgi:DNA-binding transcriptional ArsR family regulator
MDYKPKIKLSQDEFRVLASSTRIDILKLLDESQLTVSDVSRRLEMNKATVHEHLTKLIEVGLVSKEESPRKWVYYRLTWKGKNLLHPERVRVMVSLGIIGLAIVIGTLLIASQTNLLFYGDTGDDGPADTFVEPATHFFWASESSEPDVYDIRFEASSGMTMTSIKKLDTYIETDPTSITRREPIDLRWTRESNIIHIIDYDKHLQDHAGEYLYVEGIILDDRGIERPFDLRRYIVPTGMEIDLRISKVGIVIDTSNMTESGLVRISFTVENVGSLDVNSTPVEVFSVHRIFTATSYPVYGSPYLSPLLSKEVDIPINGSANITFEVPVRELFLRAVMVFVDPGNEMPEVPTENNNAVQDLPLEVVEQNQDAMGREPVSKESSESMETPAFLMAAMVAAVIIIVVVVAVVLYSRGR